MSRAGKRDEFSALQLELPFSEEAESPAPDWSRLPRFDSPKDDNERLLNFQWAARNGDKAAFAGMYELGRKVALKYICAHARRSRRVAELAAEEREEKAHNAISYIVERYCSADDFRIEKSFTAYLYLRVRHELFYRRKVDEIVQFMDMEKLTEIAQ